MSSAVGSMARNERIQATEYYNQDLRMLVCENGAVLECKGGLWDDVDVSRWQGLRQAHRAALEGPISLASSGVMSTSHLVHGHRTRRCTRMLLRGKSQSNPI